METLSASSGMMEPDSKSAAELRKNKPLMEKRRRARINDSLNKLKGLVLDAMKRDTSRYSKLEKADILEMTVKHLRTVQRQQMAVAMANDTTVVSKYRAGFMECASEVTRYLGSIDGLDPQVRNRLLNHLSDCTTKVASTVSAMQQQQEVAPPHVQSPHQPHLLAAAAAPGQHHQAVRVQIPSATPMSGLPGGVGYHHHHHHAPSSPSRSPPATCPSTTVTSLPAPVVSAPTAMSLQSPPSGTFGMMAGGQLALLVPSADGSYAITPASSATSARYHNNVNNNMHNTLQQQQHGSSTSTSPSSGSITSPMSLTSPTSDTSHVFRYGSPSAASCSSSGASADDDEGSDVALDMRVEPCRDVNANVIVVKPPTVSHMDYHRKSASPGAGLTSGFEQHRARPGMLAQNAPQQQVKVEDMWRPW